MATILPPVAVIFPNKRRRKHVAIGLLPGDRRANAAWVK